MSGTTSQDSFPAQLQKFLEGIPPNSRRHNGAPYRVLPGPAFSDFLRSYLAAASAPELEECILKAIMFEDMVEVGGDARLKVLFDTCRFDGRLRITGSAQSIRLKQSGLVGGVEVVLSAKDRIGELDIAGDICRGSIAVKCREENRIAVLPYRDPRPHVGRLRIAFDDLPEIKIEATTVDSLRLDRGTLRGQLHVHHAVFGSMDFMEVGFSEGLTVLRTLIRSLIVYNCRISVMADILYSRVEGTTSLRLTHISGRANFDGTHFVDEVDCHGFRVEDRVSWQGVKAGGAWHIREATLDNRPPDVRDVRAEHFHGEDVIYFFRALRRWAEDAKSQVDASRYFAYEQRAIRNTRARFLDVSMDPVFSRLYDWISGYGNDIGRAACWFVLWNGTFAFLLVLTDEVTGGSSYLGSHVRAGIGLALQNVVNPLVLFTEKPAFAPTSALTFALSLMQSLGSLVILALLILAIRRRFHKASE
jgi:hypothetical protein